MQAETWNKEFSKGLLNPDQALPQHVRGEKRFGVYRNNVTVSLIAALGNNFPAIKKLLGETYFNGFAGQFAQNNPPQTRLMFEYGSGFPSALAADPDLQKFPYLEDVAKLEVFWREAYHETDRDVLRAEALSSIPQEELGDVVFEPHPAMRTLQSPFAAGSIFIANRALGEAVDDWTRPESVLITRPNLDVITTLISESQHAFIAALQRGENLASAADFGFEMDENFDVGAVLAIILQNGAFATLQGKAL